MAAGRDLLVLVNIPKRFTALLSRPTLVSHGHGQKAFEEIGSPGRSGRGNEGQPPPEAACVLQRERERPAAKQTGGTEAQEGREERAESSAYQSVLLGQNTLCVILIPLKLLERIFWQFSVAFPTSVKDVYSVVQGWSVLRVSAVPSRCRC